MRAAAALLLALACLPGAARPQGSVCAIGGGGENYGSWSDSPYRWIVQQADSQAIVVLSANAEDRWIPDYFQSFGADTAFNLRIASSAVANDSATYRAIRACRGVFIKGGDQWDYVSQWRGTLTQHAIRDVFLAGGVVSGTSAGAAVLGDVVFDARYGSAVSRTSLRNPRSTTLSLTTDFLNLVPFCLFDSHFYERGRFGRLLAMMAKHQSDAGRRIHGVGLESETAIAIGPDGVGEVMGAGSVIVYYPQDRTRIATSAGLPLVYTDIKTDHLVAGYRYSFVTHQTVYVPPSATPPGAGAADPPASDLFLFGDPFPAEPLVTRLVTAGGGPSARFAVIAPPAFAATGQRYVDTLRARGVSEAVLILLDAAAANDPATAAAIGRASGVVFTSNYAEQFPSLVDSSTLAGAALRSRLRSGIAAGFASQDARFAGSSTAFRTELEELAAYRGRLTLGSGLRAFRNLVVMPLIFQSDVYDWNRVAGLPWAMARTDGKTGIFLDEGSSATVGRTGIVEAQGATPAVIVDAHPATAVGYSTFRHSGGTGPRQSTALVRAVTHVIAGDVRFDALSGTILTGVHASAPSVPSRVGLLQAYPNPFNAETNLVFELPGAGQARVVVHDLLGREVAVLADGLFAAGRHTLRFDAAGLATGAYICRLIAAGTTATRTVVVLR